MLSSLGGSVRCRVITEPMSGLTSSVNLSFVVRIVPVARMPCEPLASAVQSPTASSALIAVPVAGFHLLLYWWHLLAEPSLAKQVRRRFDHVLAKASEHRPYCGREWWCGCGNLEALS